jgi:hypothetical protein
MANNPSIDELFPIEPAARGNSLSIDELFPVEPAAPVRGPRASMAQVGRERVAGLQESARSLQDFVGDKLTEYGGAVRESARDVPSAERGARSATQGFIAGIPGQFGDIETAGRAGLRAAGANVRDRSLLPTTERVGNFAYGRPSTSEEESLRELGSFFSPLGGLARMFTRGVSGTVGRLVPESSPPLEAHAGRLEREGIKLDATQTARSEPLQSPGSLGNRTRNQEQVNRAVTREAGLESPIADSTWLAGRSEKLGQEYDRIFGRPVKLDANAQSVMRGIRDRMMAILPASDTQVIRTADNILGRISQPGLATDIPGSQMQDLRNNISAIARRGGPEGRLAGEMVAALDDVFIYGLPQAERTAMRDALNLNNRRYGAFAELERLADRGYARGGNVDLLALGDQMAPRHSQFSQGTARNPLSELALAGREVNMTGLTRGAEGRVPPNSGAISNILSAIRTLPVRTETARNMQRNRAAGRPAVANLDLYGPVGTATAPLAAAGRDAEDRR